MDPNSGEIVIATPKDIAKAEKKLGRALKPGDPIKTESGRKVLVSAEVARKMALAKNEENRLARLSRKRKPKAPKVSQKLRARRKRTEARNRAKHGK